MRHSVHDGMDQVAAAACGGVQCIQKPSMIEAYDTPLIRSMGCYRNNGSGNDSPSP